MFGLRDIIAIVAMWQKLKTRGDAAYEHIAEWSYKQADAMMKERDK